MADTELEVDVYRISTLIEDSSKSPTDIGKPKALNSLRMVAKAAPLGTRIIEGRGTGESGIHPLFAIDSQDLMMEAAKLGMSRTGQRLESLQQVNPTTDAVLRWLGGERDEEAQQAVRDVTDVAARLVIADLNKPI